METKLSGKPETLKGLSAMQRNLHLNFSQASRVLKISNSLKELSQWMRTHTGPSDGTHEILCRAVGVLEGAGQEID